jgi:hypothetical protein
MADTEVTSSLAMPTEHWAKISKYVISNEPEFHKRIRKGKLVL